MSDSLSNTYKIPEDAMKKLHQCTLEILDFFVEICKENNLRYYLMYGTLLGAVRHKGPIPWDDDVDVCMPREDFERFKQMMLARPEGETYHIHCFENDQNFPILFSKLLKKGTVYKVGGTVALGARFTEIWIDIFPLDNSPGSSRLRTRLRGEIIRWMKVLLSTKALKQTEYVKFKRKCVHMILKPIPIKLMYSLTERLIKPEKKKEYNFYVNWGDKYDLRKKTMPKEWYREPVKVLYSGKYYDAPCEWDKVLKHLYGDYMKLPSEEERVEHDPIELDI